MSEEFLEFTDYITWEITGVYFSFLDFFFPSSCSSLQNLWNLGKTGGSIRRNFSSQQLSFFKESLHVGGIKEGSKYLVLGLWHQHFTNPERQVAAAHSPERGDPKDICVGAYWETQWKTFFLACLKWFCGQRSCSFQKGRFVSLVIASAHAFFWQASGSRFFTMMSENCCVEVNNLELRDYFFFF